MLEVAAADVPPTYEYTAELSVNLLTREPVVRVRYRLAHTKRARWSWFVLVPDADDYFATVAERVYPAIVAHAERVATPVAAPTRRTEV